MVHDDSNIVWFVQMSFDGFTKALSKFRMKCIRSKKFDFDGFGVIVEVGRYISDAYCRMLEQFRLQG